MFIQLKGVEPITIDKYDTPNSELTVTDEEYWHSIYTCKKRFINYDEDPHLNPIIRSEVADSWIRSKHYLGKKEVDLEKNRITGVKLQQRLKENQLLVEGASPLFSKYLELATSSGYTMALFDKDGMFLAGTHQKISDIPVAAVHWSERNTGTTAHSLALYHKKPFLLIGPEQWADVLYNSISFAAPILDEDDVVLGALVIRQIMGKKPWEETSQNNLKHTLGWVSSMAMSIGQEIALRKRNIKLQSLNEILDVTLEFVDEGIITVDREGYILRTNLEGSRMLDINKPADAKYCKISEFLKPGNSIMAAITENKDIDYVEETICTGKGEQPFMISVRMVDDNENSGMQAAVLRLTPREKINALISSKTGTTVKFDFSKIIGESKAIKQAKVNCMQFGKTRENILLIGESGTGKEVFAHAIHNICCPNGPFIAMNCAAIPRNLIESELFGYERGSFTGAEKNGRPGKIELADGGTLFLDEIGDMPYELQAVLLRVLQDKEVARIGSKRTQVVNFRLIAATNHNLWQMVEERTFREDLYYRLSVLTVEIPPLRERKEDIILLAEYFIEQYANRIGKPVPVIGDSAREVMMKYNWPGNVRQLENAMIYAVNMTENITIEANHLPKELFYENQSKKIPIESWKINTSQENFRTDLSLKEHEKQIIERTLAQTNNTVSIAAKILGISKTSIYRKMKEYGIEY